ncbi:hypothetical protein [Crossiella cryophila]|uniref:Uncharacterized protein n=1 Tax=Crossiella cryophila TaxID=43355 RepID=A0A7W7CB56_9PSEU|nr:hypothetical protein [Crossiella cryophila]MBB4677777.1 hypothetical protein [Crossiella cryophila]
MTGRLGWPAALLTATLVAGSLTTPIARAQVPQLAAEGVRAQLTALCRSGPRSPLCETADSLGELFHQGMTIAGEAVAELDLEEALKSQKVAKGDARAVVAGKVAAVGKQVGKSSALAKFKEVLKPSKGVIALWAVSALYTLAQEDVSTVDKAEAVLAIVPILGPLFSFGNSYRKEDVEGMVISTVALAATLIAFLCPPVGAGIGVGLAVYQVVRAFCPGLLAKVKAALAEGANWFRRHVFADPDGDWRSLPLVGAADFQRAGGLMHWDTDTSDVVEASDVAHVVTPLRLVAPGAHRATLTLASAWPEEVAAEQEPIEYRLAAGRDLVVRLRTPSPEHFALTGLAFRQDGQTLPTDCRTLPSGNRACVLRSDVLVTAEHEVKIDLEFSTGNGFCPDEPGCELPGTGVIVEVTGPLGPPVPVTMPITVTGF